MGIKYHIVTCRGKLGIRAAEEWWNGPTRSSGGGEIASRRVNRGYLLDVTHPHDLLLVVRIFSAIPRRRVGGSHVCISINSLDGPT